MTLFTAFGQFAGQTPAAAVTNDFELITSTTFTSQTSVSIDNCFSATYDDYMIVRSVQGAAGNPAFNVRLRSSGTDSTSGYNTQYIYSSSTSVGSARNTTATSFEWGLGYLEQGQSGLCVTYISNPFGVGYTSLWTDHSYDISGNILYQSLVMGHETAGSYDGFTALTGDASSMTGTIYVYGWRV